MACWFEVWWRLGHGDIDGNEKIYELDIAGSDLDVIEIEPETSN